MSLWFVTNVFESVLGIAADVEIKNVSRKYKERKLVWLRGHEIYFTMKDSTGKELMELPYQTGIRYPKPFTPGSVRIEDLEPGSERLYLTKSDIGERFDLSRGGTFTIRAQSKVRKLDNSGEILLQSNEETITIDAERKEGR
jgi:hypothetical protein